MSTRCLIAKKIENGYKAIYCHFDGYPKGVGETLKNHYKTDAKVEVLLNQGDIAILGTDPIDRNGEKYWCYLDRHGGRPYFPTKEDTISYKSRGENSPAVFYPEMKDMEICGIEYVYVWQDGHWTLML